ncbi:MAG: scavenger receptor cysteine-rich domain-containing protein, partial [Ramlibacter sp.]|nr:scavenger receptor cysteine-rich domain-containing protein [Ramlibacter sp.]
SSYPGGAGLPVALGEVWCPSSAMNTTDCYFYTYQFSGCSNNTNVGLDCRPMEFGVRIVPGDGDPTTRGRVEVSPSKFPGTWGTVNSYGFDDNDALAACHSAGFTNISAAFAIQNYGGGANGSVYLANVDCTQTESYLQNCSYTFLEPSQSTWYQHSEDVGVDCSGVPRPTDSVVAYNATVDAPGDQVVARIASYLGVAQSRIWVLWNATNGTDGFQLVVFRFTDNTTNTYQTRAYLDYEFMSLSSWTVQYYFGIYTLYNNMSSVVAATMQFRLMGGSRNSTGRLEVRPDSYSGWGTVCGYGFNKAAAVAACHSLGFAGTGGVVVSNIFGMGTLYIYIEDVTCTSANQYFQNCSWRYVPSSATYRECYHSQDVAIDCAPPPPPVWTFMLQPNASGPAGVGLLLARPNSTAPWGTVCSSYFYPQAASLVCSALGYQTGTAEIFSSYPGGAGLPVALGEVWCPSSAMNTTDCYFYTYQFSGCSNNTNVGL